MIGSESSNVASLVLTVSFCTSVRAPQSVGGPSAAPLLEVLNAIFSGFGMSGNHSSPPSYLSKIFCKVLNFTRNCL